MGVASGIGFTMALFIAQLAFPTGPLLEAAKLGILLASGAAALGSYALGSVLLPKVAQQGAAGKADAEASALD
jgi:NhaA family Na+:H+ antiporter